MYEQDYIMWLIKEMVRTLLKLLFNIDTQTPSTELLEDAEEKQTLENLLDMVDEGQINEAENSLYDLMESTDKSALETGLLFYSYLNDKTDAFLEEHDFNRLEVKQGLESLTSRYGIKGLADLFLN